MLELKNYIDGQWVSGNSSIENINPSDTSDIIGTSVQGSAADIDAAVAAAKAAFISWRESGPQARHDLLDAVGTMILARKEAIGYLLSREEGKTLAEGIGETARAGQLFKFFAGEALRCTGERVDSVRPNVDVDIVREPLGVVGLITPWNFPIAIPAWKIAPALAYGNCVVFKPACSTPGVAGELVKIFEECGVPAGVLNMVMGGGEEVGGALVSHRDVAAISFTGSVGVGARISRECGILQKKVQLEMGGKNPMIIMDDADLEKAIPACINGAYFSTGQRCTASSRFIVHRGIHDQFVDKIRESIAALTVGNALEKTTDIGPVIDAKQLASNLDYVQLAKDEGAEVHGGERLELATPGYYQAPAIFLNSSNAMRINREEIFGPCASVIKCDDFDEAITLANDTDFGLSSGICTSSLKYAREFKRRADAGVLMVNLPTAGLDYHVPFGGRKGSSYGPKEQGKYAVEFYTMVKTAYSAA
ncbi:MAG: aldehyde dehydrogenase family protein [Haliea sp.]|uniref:aldehyde dehydrogenase family protein n=1 Tax=Marinobacter salarius TaxID=1420917 RepID=UPI0032F09B60